MFCCFSIPNITTYVFSTSKMLSDLPKIVHIKTNNGES